MTPVVLINNLNAGGMERVCVTLCNQWHREGRRFRLVCLHAGGQLESQVEAAIDLEIWNCRNRDVLFRLAKLARSVGRQTPFLIFGPELAAAAGLLKRVRLCPNRVVYREPNATWSISTSRRTRLMYRWLVSQADGFVAQTRSTAADLRTITGTRRQLAIIPNPCNFVVGRDGLRVRLPEGAHGRLDCLAVGRLAPQKGYDRLLPAFAEVARRFPRACLRIAGEGALRREIECDIVRLGLQGRVELLGHVERPDGLYGQADVLFLASYYEGLPNVVIEALAFGCPAIAAAGKGGTAEFLAEIGLGEYLVHGDFVGGLADKVELLCRADSTGWQNARRAMGQRVHPKIIADEFWRVLCGPCS